MKIFSQKSIVRGFSLIELLVVIAIIGLLSSIVLVAVDIARVRAQDSARQANLVQVQQALELYYSDNSTYPLAGTIAGGRVSNTWKGQCQAGGYLTTANMMIPDLISGGYISQLPSDPLMPDPAKRTNLNYCCYQYKSTGTDYKFEFFKGVSGSTCFTSAAGTGQLADPIANGAWSVYSPGGASF